MSKELEAFESIKFGCCNFEDRTLYQDEFDIIEAALKRLEQYENETQSIGEMIGKKLKALEIIVKKKVDTKRLLYYLKTNACDDNVLCWYNEYGVDFDTEKTLTQEEYDLLKEVLL